MRTIHGPGPLIVTIQSDISSFAAQKSPLTLAAKKETPFYQLPKLHELSRRIAELTEELEELKSEKSDLLNEEAEARSVREFLRRKQQQQVQQIPNKKKSVVKFISLCYKYFVFYSVAKREIGWTSNS